MCSEENDFDVPARYTSIGKQSCTLLFLLYARRLYTLHCVDDARRSSIDELQNTLPRNMVFSSEQIRLSNTVGQGNDFFVSIASLYNYLV